MINKNKTIGFSITVVLIIIGFSWYYLEKKSDLIILCAGDSLTAGGYPNWLQKRFNENKIKVTVIDRGVKGHTSGEYLRYMKRNNILRESDPDIILLQLGTNDVRIDADYTPTQQFINNMNQIILESIQYKNSRGKNPTVLISTILPINDTKVSNFNQKSVQRVTEEINPAIEKLAVKWNLQLVNNYQLFQDRNELLPGIHPTEKGYKVMSENWFKHLLSIIKKKKVGNTS